MIHSAARVAASKKDRKRSKRRTLFESLEQRCLLAAITGTVFVDDNSDGVRDPAESGAQNVQVYVDFNNNRQADPNEPSTFTDANGEYSFENIAPRGYRVRIDSSGGVQTFPTNFIGSGTQGLGSNRVFDLAQDGFAQFFPSFHSVNMDDVVRTNDGSLLGINATSDTIYSLDPITGAQTELSRAGVDLESGLAYDAGTDTIYTVINVDGDVSIATVNRFSGQLGSTAAVTPTDLLVMNFSRRFYNFDLATENATLVPGSTLPPRSQSLDARSDGVLFGVSASSTLNRYAVTEADAAGNTVANLDRAISAIGFNRLDQLMGVSETNSTLYRIDTTTGATSNPVPIRDLFSRPIAVTGFDIGPDGVHYVINASHLFTVDPDTGRATQLPNPAFSGAGELRSLTVAADGSLFATTNSASQSVIQIDPETGAGTVLDSGTTPGAAYDAIAAPIQSLGAGGLAGVGTVSDLAFDYVSQRVVGFSNSTDQFFEFETDGVGRLLATANLPIDSTSLAFDGNGFLMLDDASPGNTQSLLVDPDTGNVSSGPLLAQSRLDAESLQHNRFGDVPHLVNLGDETRTNVDFGLADSIPVGIDRGDPGYYINEIMLDPQMGSPDRDQYLEIRGPAGGKIPANTYFVVVDEDNNAAGTIHTVIDLSDQALGANGFLNLVQLDSLSVTDPASLTLASTSAGFGGLPGDIYSDADDGANRLNGDGGANGYFLITSSVPPVVGESIDANQDGRADSTGLLADWEIRDSVSIHPGGVTSRQAYGQILLQDTAPPNRLNVIVESGVEVSRALGSGYAARIGDSVGSRVDDWVFGDVYSTGVDPNTGRALAFEFLAGQNGDPSHPAFSGRDADHLGKSNFVGGVRGTVEFLPPNNPVGVVSNPEPLANVTVFADLNGNQQRDDVNFVVDPNQAINPADPTGPHPIRNAFEGVTISTAGSNNQILGFPVESVRETAGNATLFNRIFAAAQVGGDDPPPTDTFQSTRRLRFDLYRPAKEVSIQVIGAEGVFGATYGRLAAYNAAGELVATNVSDVVIRQQRTTVTVTSADEDIAFAVAYAENIRGSASLARFDNFAYVQSEAAGISNAQGMYELPYLRPGNYDITVLQDGESEGLIGGSGQMARITDNENLQIDFLLRQNSAPSLDDEFIFAVDENAPPGTEIGAITSQDPDPQSSTFAIESGEDLGFLIDPVSGILSVAPNAVLDFEQTPMLALTVSVTDPLGASDTANVLINLLDVNEDPIVDAEVFEVAEGTINGTAIGQIQAADPDTMDNDLTFTVIGGSGAGIFNVDDSNGLITLINEAGIDFEQQDRLELNVLIRDSAPTPAVTSYTQVIHVIDQNDTPLISSTAFLVRENSVGTVAQLLVADPDSDQQHAFELLGGSGDAIFDVSDDGAIFVRPGAVVDFETATSYTLDVRVSDNGQPPEASQATITLLINNVNEPGILSPGSVELVENAAAGTPVATLQGHDPENVIADYAIRMLNSADASNFTFDPTSNELTVRAGAVLDFETDPTFEIDFELTAAGDPASVQRLTVNLRDENDAPSLITDEVIVSELATPGTPVGKVEVQVRDEDQVDFATTVIIGGNAQSLFDLDPNTRVLTVANGATFDADVPSDPLELQVRVTDSGGLTNTGTIAVLLNDVNEPPVFTAAAPTIDTLGSGQPLEYVLPEDLIVDPEGREFSIAIFDANGSLPEWLDFDEASRTLSGLPRPTDAGTYELTVRAFEPGPLDLFSETPLTVAVELGATPLTNQRDTLDVDANDDVSPVDALIVINFMGRYGSGASALDHAVPFFGFVDTSADGIVTSLDALLVINGINDDRPVFAGELIQDDDDDAINDAALDELLAESSLF